ncbi:MAG: hypothetical protein GEV09_26125 [Pseudonocardiaceae bacterium]|nr:hypothetical protein [Pseudonocardiaceae bacterium]
MTKSATAVQVNSQVPLVASVVAAEGGSGEDGDVTYSTAAPSLSSPASVAMVPSSKVDASLQLTAPTKDAQVDVRALGSGVSAPKRVKIGAGKTAPVKLRAPSGSSTYGVLVTPRDGSGPVYGSRLMTAKPGEGPLLTTLPLVPGARQVSLPPVVPEVGAGVPR